MSRIILLLLLLTGCSTSNFSIDQRQNNFLNLNKDKFKGNVYSINDYDIFSVKKIKNNKRLTVYIEGDGLAWLDRFTPSNNPTPNNPIAFMLALEDKNDNIIYLARPCQYLTSNRCKKDIWTSLQYSNEVLLIYAQIINNLSNDFDEIHLVGYSGGAAIVIYLASLNELNIQSIRTVAGNINPDEISSLLKLSGYKKSVNFYSIESKLNDIPQTHYYGSKDKVIPKDLHFNYAERNKNNKCVSIQLVEASHNKGWVEFWSDNYQLNLKC